MGIFRETILVRNVPIAAEPTKLWVKVHTESTMLVVSGRLQQELRFPVIGMEAVRYATEEIAGGEAVYGTGVTICERKGVFEPVAEPQKRYGLLRVIVVQALDLIANARSQKIYVNPRSPQIPMV